MDQGSFQISSKEEFLRRKELLERSLEEEQLSSNCLEQNLLGAQNEKKAVELELRSSESNLHKIKVQFLSGILFLFMSLNVSKNLAKERCSLS